MGFKKRWKALLENPNIEGFVLGLALDEIGAWINPPPVGTDSDKIPQVVTSPPSSATNNVRYNTQNNTYNTTRISNSSTNIYTETNNYVITIPQLPSRNLPQTISGGGGSSNTSANFTSNVKKSLATRSSWGGLLANPFYESDSEICFYTDFTEDGFLNEINSKISSYHAPTVADGELPDVLDTALAFMSFNDQGYAVPVPSLGIINEVSAYYGAASKTAGFEVTGLINVGSVSINNCGKKSSKANYPHLVANTGGNDLLPLWELLGYEETVFKGKSIEQVIKDFLAKVYDTNGELLPINTNFETTEQFIAGSIGTLFYRLGLNKLPFGEDDSPTQNLTDILLLLLSLLNLLKGEKDKKIWELLGYSENEFQGKSIEQIIKDFGEKIYLNKPVNSVNDNVLKDVGTNFTNMEQLIVGVGASLFYRGGFHRLPGKLPESLSFDTDKYKNANEQPSIFIEDMVEYNEYLIKNLDEIFGQFPLNFTYTAKNESGTEEKIKIKFDNIAEVLLEMSGLMMDVNNTTDILTNLALKNLAENIKSVNGSLLTIDLAKVIVDYLGCEYKEILKDRTLPVTGDATSFPEYLKDSEVKMLGVKIDDKATVKGAINTLLINTGIAKLALSQRKDFITGDAIRDLINKKTTGAKDKYNKDWDELMKEYQAVNDKRTKFPKAKIKDKSINKPD